MGLGAFLSGCGNVDPHFNEQKNIRSLNGKAEPMTLAQMRKLPDPVKGFKVGNTREKIRALVSSLPSTPSALTGMPIVPQLDGISIHGSWRRRGITCQQPLHISIPPVHNRTS